MREGSATPLAGATSEKSDRAVAATEEGVAPEEAPTPSTRTRGSSKKVRLLAQRAGQLFLVALAHVAAFAVDWLLVPTSYPVAAAYGLSLILAAHLLASPVVVAALGVVALALSIASNLLQAAPIAAVAGNNAGLFAIGVPVIMTRLQNSPDNACITLAIAEAGFFIFCDSSQMTATRRVFKNNSNAFFAALRDTLCFQPADLTQSRKVRKEKAIDIENQ